MEAFKVYHGQTVPYMLDNIDTDQILPKTYLKLIEKTGFGPFLFDDLRYLENRKPNPDFVLNFPEYKNATILVTGENFGSGSSREHAAWALLGYGFKAVIGGSFGDIFYMNATKNGLLPIELEQSARKKIAVLDPETELTIDLPNQKVITPETSYPFEIDAETKHKLINGLDEIAITLEDLDLIEAYEKKLPSYWQ
ncbi:MAG TPA: 3-isopropylmalate dehydratase small subunit [Tetragenococcus sp.]|nr:3-isopropylmalate dehydratase small subunit [Tetragenococcus sp.]